MKYSIISVTVFFAGLAVAHDSGHSSATLQGSMTDAIDAARKLDHVVGGYHGGDAEDVECAINTAVVILREATDMAHRLTGPLSPQDAQSFEALGQVGGNLVNTFGNKIPVFNDGRICNSITTHVTDLDDQVSALVKAVGSNMATGHEATASKTQSTFTELKDSMDTCNACGVIGDDSHTGAPLGGPNGTFGAGKYPGPINSNGAAAVSVSCGAMLLGAIAAFLI
ncbi:hypothetical protein PGQ11_008031 [Apiospora arundinis]|uniref:Uncharacterized protein n=1 Tax=Apiospora arundinis TaxID=335852 RepID=A0ABR2IDR0_9PEZI